MTDHAIIGKDGRLLRPRDTDYTDARVNNLEDVVGELIAAVYELQERLDRVDGHESDWPLSGERT